MRNVNNPSQSSFLSREAKIEIQKKLYETRPRVGKFDQAIAKGELPSVEEFRQICRDRGQIIHDENTLNPSTLSEALIKDAERLERAANGDGDELIAEALKHADFYKWLGADAEPDKYKTDIDGWNRLAESAKATNEQK